MGFRSSMTHYHGCLFVVVCCAVATVGIRVDWNTNHGPIVPPTSTPAPVPQPPFRQPAPVWEDQSNDIANPNPYRYIPPPPSRPRYNPDYLQQTRHNVNNIHPTIISPSSTTFGSSSTTTLLATAPTSTSFYSSPTPTTSTSTSTTTSSTSSSPSTTRPAPTYGTILTRSSPHAAGQSQSVSSLAVKYVPNVGKQYVAVVPAAGAAGQTKQYLSGNEVYDKYNGKYNAKLKKYKAFEQKAKMVPYVMYYMPKQQFIYYNNFGAKSVAQTKQQWSPNRY